MLPTGEIREWLQKLVGLSAWKATFAASTLCMQFGSKREVTARSGKTVLVGEFALHVQELWRLSTTDEILVGATDHHCHEERDNTAEIGPLVQAALSREPRVLAVEYVRAGAFALALEGDLYFEVVPASRAPAEKNGFDEFWRMLSSDIDGPHFIVTPNGVELSR